MSDIGSIGFGFIFLSAAFAYIHMTLGQAYEAPRVEVLLPGMYHEQPLRYQDNISRRRIQQVSRWSKYLLLAGSFMIVLDMFVK